MLQEYEKLLKKWTKKINLISPSTLETIHQSHFQDALELIPHLKKTDVIIDLGSGNGIPGMVLALQGHPYVHLIECDIRKTVFLKEVARITKIQVSIHPTLIENYQGPKADVITCRGFASLEEIIKVGKPLLKESGKFLALKGKGFQEELKKVDAQKFHYKVHELTKGVIVEIW